MNKQTYLPDLDLVEVEGDEFLMGSDESEYENEKPAHLVVVPSFYIGKYPVTQRLYEAVMGNNPSYFKEPRRPVETVSWNDAQEFLRKLNEKLNDLPGKSFRLPTEAEWEYAARGGQYSKGYLYAGSDSLKEVGWYSENSYNETKAVGLKDPNELGLYDMSGNVWEWCEDDRHYNYQGAPNDGSPWIDTPKRIARRVLRGGSYFDYASDCRPSHRDYDDPSVRDDFFGFRLCLSV